MAQLLSRRSFLKCAGAAVLAGAASVSLTGCIPIHIRSSQTLSPTVGGITVTAKYLSSSTQDGSCKYKFYISLKNSLSASQTVARDDFAVSAGSSQYTPESWSGVEGDTLTLEAGREESFILTFACKTDAEKLIFQHGGESISYTVEQQMLTLDQLLR